MKGIVITPQNQNTLLGSYTTALDLEQLPIGYILVTDFGNEDTFETLTPEEFALAWTVGETLQNGYFDMVAKP